MAPSGVHFVNSKKALILYALYRHTEEVGLSSLRCGGQSLRVGVRVCARETEIACV